MRTDACRPCLPLSSSRSRSSRQHPRKQSQSLSFSLRRCQNRSSRIPGLPHLSLSRSRSRSPEPARELEACSCCLLNSAHAAVLDHARNYWWQACLKICLRSWPMAGHSQLANKATRSCIDVAQEFVQHAHSCQASSLHSARSALFKV